MRLTNLLFIVAAATGACGGSSGTDAMRGSVADAVGEDQTYLAASRAATTMPDMLVAVDHHAARMDVILGDMTGDMDSMQHCAGMMSMMGLRDDMSAEMTAHVAAMHQMTNLGDARTEVGHHVGIMQTMADDMDYMLAGMHCH